MLPYIRRKKDIRGGSLLGTVWDCYRAGEKTESIGAEWEYVGKIDVSSAESLRAGLLALDGSPLTSVNDDLVKELDHAPLPYETIFVPKTAAALARYLTKGGGGGGGAKSAGSASDAPGEGDPDIPFS